MTDAPEGIWATPMDSDACPSGTFIPADGDRPNADARHYTRSDLARPPVAVKPLDQDSIAKLVYEAMSWTYEEAGKIGPAPKWVEGGNSFAQDKARDVATRIREALA